MNQASKVVFLLCLLAVPAGAQSPPSDDEIRAQMIGNWISAPVPYRDPDNMLQVFRADGTSTAYFFKDASCAVLLASIAVTWSIEDGVLVMSYDAGFEDRDQVAAIDAEKLTLRSLDLADTEMERLRAPATCREP